MSTATEQDRVLDTGPGPAAAAPMVTPPKLRRRPALVAGAVVAILLGALLAGWAWTVTTTTQDVVVARNGIARGEIIEAEDLARVSVNADPVIASITASELDGLIGQRAALDIAEGALVTPESVAETVVPGGGMSVVGVAVTPAQAPGVALQPGDRVRIVVTPAQGEPANGSPPFGEAEVVAVHPSVETGQTIVDVLVSHSEAAVLAARVAAGNVALVLDSRER